MMNITRASKMQYVPASHEDPKNPGSLKKVLVKKDDVMAGRLQMVNWSLLPAGKSFAPHYHEDLEELFIIMKGEAEITVGSETSMVIKGDAIIVAPRIIHSMKNTGQEDVEFLAIGISGNKGGKTVTVTQ